MVSFFASLVVDFCMSCFSEVDRKDFFFHASFQKLFNQKKRFVHPFSCSNRLNSPPWKLDGVSILDMKDMVDASDRYKLKKAAY